MINQTQNPNHILMERLTTIQKISEVTAEHLRLTQIHAGYQVLDMRDDDENTMSMQLRQATLDLTNCEAKLSALETDLARLDRELELSVGGEPT